MTDDTKPKRPYQNRWGTEPGPDYRRCLGVTKKGGRCRRGASDGSDFCDQHETDETDDDDLPEAAERVVALAVQLLHMSKGNPGEAATDALSAAMLICRTVGGDNGTLRRALDSLESAIEFLHHAAGDRVSGYVGARQRERMN